MLICHKDTFQIVTEIGPEFHYPDFDSAFRILRTLPAFLWNDLPEQIDIIHNSD